MEMPRSCSSRSRSVFLPVRAVISAVLPWSMCPAVPTVSGAWSVGPAMRPPSGERREHRAGELLDLRVTYGAQVEQQLAVLDAADYGRLPRAQRRSESRGVVHIDRDGHARHLR